MQKDLRVKIFMDGILNYHTKAQNLMALLWFNLDSVVRGHHISLKYVCPISFDDKLT